MRGFFSALLLGIVSILTGDESSATSAEPFSTKTWLGDMNFLNGNNWNLKRRPCWKDRAILPASLELALRLPDGETTLQQLVLPKDGELLLPKRGALTVTDTKNLLASDPTCPGEDILFLRSKIPLWVDPDNWDGHNSATPDLEAIPCATDRVLFTDNSFSVQMPDIPPKVAALNVFGADYEGRTFTELVASDVGRAAFFTASRRSLPEVHVTKRRCDDATGCECANEPLRAAVCATVHTHCAAARCLKPVTPQGNCCPICGGFVLFKFTSSFKLDKFRQYLSEKFGNKDVNFFASKSNGLIQVVFLERGEYEGKVDDYTKELKESVSDLKGIGLEFVQEFAAGPYVAPATFSSVVRLLIGLLFLALSVFAIIFCVHTEECKVNSNGQRQYLFAVFENQGEEVELCKPEAETPVVPPRSRRQAFDNPMYGAAAQETLTQNEDDERKEVEEEEDDDDDDDDDEEDCDFPHSMEENNHIYATMETVDLLGKIDATHEEETINGKNTHISG